MIYIFTALHNNLLNQFLLINFITSVDDILMCTDEIMSKVDTVEYQLYLSVQNNKNRLTKHIVQ